jgi:hypothetical protein
LTPVTTPSPLSSVGSRSGGSCWIASAKGYQPTSARHLSLACPHQSDHATCPCVVKAQSRFVLIQI